MPYIKGHNKSGICIKIIINLGITNNDILCRVLAPIKLD
jgi:hypothetical protein